VNKCTPTVTSITPSTWFAGKTYDNVVIKGTGFVTTEAATDACPVTQVSATTPDGSVVTVSNVNVASSTSITLTVASPSSDPAESATVTVGTAPNTATAEAQIEALSAEIIDTSDIMNGNVSVKLTAPSGTNGDLTLNLYGQQNSSIYTLLDSGLAEGSKELKLSLEGVQPDVYPTADGTWDANLPSTSTSQTVDIPTYTLPTSWTYFRKVRFTQYNTPDENAQNDAACRGSQANAWIVTAVATTNAQGKTKYKCSFEQIALNSEFIQQTWINGTGRSRNYGLLQNAAAVLLGDHQRCRGQYPPGARGHSDAGQNNGNTFVRATAIVPSCPHMTLEDGGAAMPVDKDTMEPTKLSGVIPLQCGYQLNLDAEDYQTAHSRTIVDKCKKCSDPDSLSGADGHVDSYTTESACRRSYFKDLDQRTFFYTSNITE
jgi:hypothetical protein